MEHLARHVFYRPLRHRITWVESFSSLSKDITLVFFRSFYVTLQLSWVGCPLSACLQYSFLEFGQDIKIKHQIVFRIISFYWTLYLLSYHLIFTRAPELQLLVLHCGCFPSLPLCVSHGATLLITLARSLSVVHRDLTSLALMNCCCSPGRCWCCPGCSPPWEPGRGRKSSCCGLASCLQISYKFFQL